MSVGWGQRAVLAGINLDINFAEFNRRVPIIGRTGLGKTTLLYALAGQASPMSGRIVWTLPDAGVRAEFGQTNGDGDSSSALRMKAFSFAFQDAMLVPFLTVEENLKLPLQLNGHKRTSRGHDDVVDRILSKFLIDGEDIATFRKRFPYQLSGGQRQRMALAQALATDPKVLFSDEPTGNLDPQTRREIMLVVDRWIEEDHQRVFIWITHHHEADEFGRAPFVVKIDNDFGETKLNVRRSQSVWSEGKNSLMQTHAVSGRETLV
ncbi:MAG: ABC transporter ATP-binding protein [Alphaproteobacteria bacterium]|nr:ABC transporter ATP-binding protein [Alphaproteobacteria bacterium]